MPNNTPPSPLCLLSDLPTRGSKGVQHDGHNLIVVRQGAQVHVYENRCPHRGIPLEWVPDQFLDNSGRLIQCASHGALFLPESGECIAGPCVGQSLRAFACEVREGGIYLTPTD